jgi:excisionase family DNA binding protein
MLCTLFRGSGSHSCAIAITRTVQDMPKKDSSDRSEGRKITKREETTKATRNITEENSANKKKKRRNRVEELGENLGLGRSTTYEYLDKGELPGEKIGHRWVVPDDVEDRIKALAWEKWRQRQREKGSEPENDSPPDEKPQRRRKKKSDSENDS